MKDIGTSDSSFLESIKKEIDSIRTLDKIIAQIEDDSSELELVSLNAMVAALKAGKNGGAFPYITEELQKVSKNSAGLSIQLKSRGSELGAMFADFIDNINSDKGEIETVLERVSVDFGSLVNQTAEFRKTSDSVISDVTEKVKVIKGPLYKIISEVQKHDIVRQSVDHVILALQHISEMHGDSREELLNSLSYSSRVYGFCDEILDEICSELQKNLETFRDKSQDLNTLVNFLQESGEQLECQDDEVSFDYKIRQIQANISSSLEYLKKGSIRVNMVHYIENIHKDIKSMEDSYSGFSRIISRIKTINISSRVEAAKLPHLENMSYIIESITERTDSIESLVEEIIKIITLFKKNTGILFEDFFVRSEENSVTVENFAEELRDSLNKVDIYGQKIKNNMCDLIDVGDDFLSFYKMTVSDLDKMSTLVSDVMSIRRDIAREKSAVDSDLSSQLQKAGLSSWELKGDEIRQLIDKFTIYIHKKKADTEGILDVVDEGASSGDITLF